MRRDTLSTGLIFDAYWPGSGDPYWQSEFLYMATHHTKHLNRLISDIEKRGIQEPIYLGDDGAVWDGHHRLYCAARLGLEVIPVRFAPSHPTVNVTDW